jgi:carbon starvation protein CstA
MPDKNTFQSLFRIETIITAVLAICVVVAIARTPVSEYGVYLMVGFSGLVGFGLGRATAS